jgi:hypothetical protein
MMQYESGLRDDPTKKEEPAMKLTVVIALLLVAGLLTAEPQRRGGGGRAAGGAVRAGGGAGRASGGVSANRDISRTSIRSSQDVNRSVTRNGDVNRNVNVDRDIDVHGNFYGGYDRWGHPVAAGAAAGVAGAITSAALGSTVAVLPSSCSTVVVDGIGYSQCGSTWYEPFYSGTTVQYMVVSPPQ